MKFSQYTFFKLLVTFLLYLDVAIYTIFLIYLQNYDVVSVGFSAFVNLENYYALPSGDDSISNHASGIGTQLTIQGGSLTGRKITDTGFYIEDGSSLSLESVDIMGFDKAPSAVSKAKQNIINANLDEFIGVHHVNFFNSTKDIVC